MRYYSIELRNKTTGAAILPASLGGQGITSLNKDGSFNPGALNVELDIPVVKYHIPAGAALVRIWGLSLREIGAAFDLNDAVVSVSAGMSKGLPLANPAQAGLLIKGEVFQGFGNWLGTDQTIDLLLRPPTGTVDEPKNLILNWKAGTTLATALSNTFTTAFPTPTGGTVGRLAQSINISCAFR